MKVVITADGSHTLAVPEISEHYHSTFGAVTESEHVFIKAGLEAFPSKNDMTIFEAGFGTGLNALLTALTALKEKRNITYYAIEKYPISEELAAKLNYPTLHGLSKAGPLFKKIHQLPWNRMCRLHTSMQMMKIEGSLPDFVPAFKCDVVYFDAFAPEKQPEMWTLDIFSRIHDSMNVGGLLTTYCVKGIVKNRMREAGFRIEKLPGPPGKREMLRAWKQ